MALLNKRDDLARVPGRTLALELGIPLVAMLLALGASVPRGSGGMGLPIRRFPLVLLGPLVFVTATLLTAPADVDIEPFWRHAARCLVVTSLLGAGPVLLSVWSHRRAFASAAGRRAAGLGIAGGALGAAAMSLVCSSGAPAHVLLGHGGAMIVGGLAAAVAGRRWAQA